MNAAQTENSRRGTEENILYISIASAMKTDWFENSRRSVTTFVADGLTNPWLCLISSSFMEVKREVAIWFVGGLSYGDELSIYRKNGDEGGDAKSIYGGGCMEEWMESFLFSNFF